RIHANLAVREPHDFWHRWLLAPTCLKCNSCTTVQGKVNLFRGQRLYGTTAPASKLNSVDRLRIKDIIFSILIVPSAPNARIYAGPRPAWPRRTRGRHDAFVPDRRRRARRAVRKAPQAGRLPRHREGSRRPLRREPDRGARRVAHA